MPNKPRHIWVADIDLTYGMDPDELYGMLAQLSDIGVLASTAVSRGRILLAQSALPYMWPGMWTGYLPTWREITREDWEYPDLYREAREAYPGPLYQRTAHDGTPVGPWIRPPYTFDKIVNLEEVLGEMSTSEALGLLAWTKARESRARDDGYEEGKVAGACEALY